MLEEVVAVIGVGLFGKVPNSGDFVSAGAISENRRAFERWLHMCNDRAAELRRGLPPGPLGFVFRGLDPSTLLCGVLRASRDRVGRSFPLAVFCEVALTPSLPCHALPSALAPQLTELASLARMATESSLPDVLDDLRQVELPATEHVVERTHRVSEALSQLEVGPLLTRSFSDIRERSFGFEVFAKAVATLGHRSPRRPLVLSVQAVGDVDLLFWSACAEAACPPQYPYSTLWNPSMQRLFVVLGVPDSNVYPLVGDSPPHSERLWPLWPNDNAALERCSVSLPGHYLHRLADDGSSVGELIEATRALVAERRADVAPPTLPTK